MRREHHAERRAPIPVRLGAIERPGERVLEQLEQVRLQPQEDRLRLRVAQPAVELQRLRIAGPVDHQARVQEAGVGHALLCHALHRGQDDLAHHARVDFRRHYGRRRIRAHAAGVGPGVAVAQALVVLAGGERQDMRAVAHHDEARLFAFEKFLDDDTRPGGAQALIGEHHVDRGMRLFACPRHHHALSAGEAVGLDDDRSAMLDDIGLGVRGALEARVAGGRDAMARHERLGEILRRLELRRGSRRAENPESRRAKRVDHAGGERRFGTDDGQLNIFLPCEGNQVWKRAQGDVFQPGLESGAGIARRDVDFLHARALGELPCERVLAPAGTDHEQLHFSGGSAARR